jgi:hypothetical protein
MSKWLAVANGLPNIPPTAPSDIKVSLVNFVSGGYGEIEKPKPHYDGDERVAIMAVGGMAQDWAEGFASLDPDSPPTGLSKHEWETRLDSALSFTDVHGQALHGLGWTFETLFSVGKDWVRLDQRAVGWFIAEALAGGGRVKTMNEHSIRYVTNRGAVRTIKNEKIS